MGAILYTEGGLLQYLDGRDYIGNYHIMPDGTPMGGAVHTGEEDILQYNPNRAKVSIVNPAEFTTQGFELSDQSIIPDSDLDSFFNPTVDKIEFLIYDISKNLLLSQPDFRNYKVENNKNTDQAEIEEIILSPSTDLSNNGFTTGALFAVYNFITPEINDIFISEISPDRTEIRLQSNILNSEEIREEVSSLKNKIDSVGFFDELYLNLGNNKYYIVVNLQLDVTTSPTSFLVKLYQPLPDDISTKTQLEIVSKISETQAYEVDFPNIIIPIDDTISIKGPNVNLKIKDKVNNSTEYQNLTTLTTSSFTASLNQSSYLLNQTGISLNPSYSISDYSDFVHFSSAKKRLENFYDKIGEIEANQNSIDALGIITGPSSGSSTTLTSVAVFENRITDTIKNFDGFEYFLYYNSSSNAYPKSNSNAPYLLQSTGSAEVLNWLGSDVVGSTYYGGALLSASRFDDDNASNLKYTIPEFIRDNSDNNNYLEFVNLVGQHFDEIWLYIKAITEKLRATNNLETGVPPELVEETLKSFGYDVYGNNFDSNDIFTGLIGINESGSYFPETQNEVITTAISASNTPIPINDVSKEIYKRLYHNLVYLAKRKGTISGLRSLINIWGLPDTVLRIYEFGGKDKINNNDWDLYRRIFNKEITTHQIDADRGKEYNGSVETPWKINPLWAGSTPSSLTGSVPSTVEFRFKSDIDPSKIPLGDIPVQPLWSLDDAGDTKVLVYLEYSGSGSTSASFNGSGLDPNYQYANLTLAVSGSPPTSASISLPFYNQDWWNVRVQMQETGLVGTNQSRYQIASANKIYNGKDGTKIGFEANSELTQISGSWVNPVSSSFALSQSFNGVNYPHFSGSLQEIRYWTLCFNNQNDPLIDENVWDNHVMNPLSFETGYITGSGKTPQDNLVFRSREGEDLSLTSGSQGNLTVLESIHPKITGSFNITSSFIGNSFYKLITSSITNNTEIQFLNNPNLGSKNRISDKIETYNNSAYGDVLSPLGTIQQNYEISQSFTEDNNLLQVAFSPQDEINDDIINQLGFNNNITEQLADPRNLSSSLNYYDGLRDIALRYFEKYISGNPNDYYRLIKYIDNSLFKAIKNYVPARTSVSTGIVVKQHLLERNRVRPPQLNSNTLIAKTPETGSSVAPIYDNDSELETGLNSGLVFKDITIEGVVKSQPRGFTSGSTIELVSGGTGGSFDEINKPTTRFRGFTQSRTEVISTLSGSQVRNLFTQDEFYNGEFTGTAIGVVSQSLNPECRQFLNVFVDVPSTSTFDEFFYDFDDVLTPRFFNPQTQPFNNQVFFHGNKVGSGILLDSLKISTVNKEGIDLTSILTDATRLNFSFGSLDVTKLSENSASIHYDIGTQIIFPNSVTSSNFENYNAFATSSITQSILTSNNDSSVNIPITVNHALTYNHEVDVSNLLNTSSGIYTFPQTPNLPIFFSGSIDLTGSFSTPLLAGTQLSTITLKLGGNGNGFNLTPTSAETLLIDNHGIGTPFSRSLEITGTFNNFVPLRDEDLTLDLQVDLPAILKAQNFISSSITASNASLRIFTSSVDDQNTEVTLDSYEPYFPITTEHPDFAHSFDCQPLLNNAVDITPGNLYFDIDYTTGMLVPTNLDYILSQNAKFADTPDSNYSQQSRILPRYIGSKLIGKEINFYNEGDISYGKTPVINLTKPFFGYFQLLAPTSPELEDATQVKLQYLVGLDGKANKPLLNSPSFFNVEGTYQSGNPIDIALANSLQTDDPSLVNAAAGINLDTFNTNAKVIRGARRVDPILTTQLVSRYEVGTINDAFTGSIKFEANTNESVYYSFEANNNVTQDAPFNELVTFQAGLVSNPSVGTLINTVGMSASMDSTPYDLAGLFNLTADHYVFNTAPVAGNKVKFRFAADVNFSSVTGINRSNIAFAAVVRERAGNFDIISFGNQLDYIELPYPARIQRVDFETAYTEFQASDRVFPFIYIFDAAYPDAVGLNMQIENAIFTGTPLIGSTISLEGPFWNTGSGNINTNFLTSSLSMSAFYNNSRQIQHEGSSFKPTAELFTVRIGDEFRFEGAETLTYVVTDVIEQNNTPGTSGSILVKVDPEIPAGVVDLDQFLIRRYNPDGTSVLINLIPPSSGFGTTKGIIKNISISSNLEENIGNVLSNLVEKGVIKD
jgi:hypothetical protein